MMLPRSIKGRKLTKHPLLMVADEHTTTEIAKALGIHRSSVHQYVRRIEDGTAGRDVKVPGSWVLTLSKLSGIHPHAFRPDIYPLDGVPGAE